MVTIKILKMFTKFAKNIPRSLDIENFKLLRPWIFRTLLGNTLYILWRQISRYAKEITPQISHF